MKNDMALLFKALSDENRLKILELLIKGESCGCTLIHKLPITQPTLSYHLKILTDAGLTKTYKDGVKIKHQVNHETIDRIVSFLSELKTLEETCETI